MGSFFLFFAVFAAYIMEKEVIVMTRKRIDASREVRLWIGQVIVPALGTGIMLMAHPEIREKAAEKIDSVKQRFHKT